MNCEKHVTVGTRSTDASLIHYIRVIHQLQGQGYATKMLQLVFPDEITPKTATFTENGVRDSIALKNISDRNTRVGNDPFSKS